MSTYNCAASGQAGGIEGIRTASGAGACMGSGVLFLLTVAALLSCFPAGRVASCGSVLLVGGGSEDYQDWSDRPYRWFVEHAPNRRIAILHYSTTSEWLLNYFTWLGATSDTTFAITSQSAANDSSCYRAILACDGVFLRGGDQWQYINRWKGTLAEKAIKEVYRRGGVVGGTSAGLAVLTEVIFDARTASVEPRAALRNPLDAGITFTNDFLGLVPGVLGDTHFFERGRLGRLVAMLAMYKQQTGRSITGIGVEYGTALAVDSAGTGEVMGSGTVTVLRWVPETRVQLEAGKPLSVTGLGFDQLTEGFRIALPSGLITPGSGAVAYSPAKYLGPAGTVILDGSNITAQWSGPAGGVTRLVETVVPGDTVGIISSPEWTSLSQSVESQLAQQYVVPKQLLVDDGRKEDVTLASSIARCSGIVFASNRPESAASYFDTSTAVGSAVQSASEAGIPMSFLGNDTKLPGDTVVTGTESHAYASYYGMLSLQPGLGIVRGVISMPRVYEHPDSTDNRMSGLFWGMAKSRSSFGFLVDEESSVTLKRNYCVAAGATPVMVIDARNVTITGFPAWRDPGKANPRQLAGLVGGLIHVLRDGDTLALTGGGSTGIEDRMDGPAPGFHLAQNYPNPFNPSTTIAYCVLRESIVRLTVFDLLGREVTTLARGEHLPGRYTIAFDGSNLAAGVYYYTMRAGNAIATKSFVLLK